MLCATYAYLKQIQPSAVQARHQLGQRPLGPLGEGGLEVLEGSDARPNAVVRGTHGAEDAENLIDFRVTRPEGLLVHHLSKDGTHGPNINRGGVLAGAQQDLGGAVPQGDNLMGVSPQGHHESSGKAKISNLDNAFRVDQQVLGFEVTVHDAAAVAKVQALQNLVQVGLDEGHRQHIVAGFHVLGKILLHKLKHQVKHAVTVIDFIQSDEGKKKKKGGFERERNNM